MSLLQPADSAFAAPETVDIDEMFRRALDAASVGVEALATAPGVERMYDPTESVFAIYAARMVALGWSVFPQERNSRRTPALVDGRMLKWGTYRERLPNPAEIASWSAQCPTHNVAVVTGKVSGGFVGIDVDAEDEKRSWTVEHLAYDILGKTRFRRTGRAPRVILGYRCETELTKLSVEVGGGDKVELLANGAPFTAYGKHHGVGRYFSWRGLDPAVYGPSEAPLVTADRLAEFWDALRSEFGTVAPARSRVAKGASVGVARRVGGLVVPPDADRVDGVTYADGKVSDGRESYVYRRAMAYALYNHASAAADLVGALADECRGIFAGLDGHWTHDLDEYCRARVQSACDTRDADPEKWRPRRVFGGENAGEEVFAPQAAVAEAADDEDINLLAAPSGKRRKIVFARTKIDPEQAQIRALIRDRKAREAHTAKVSGSVVETIQLFLDQLWDAVQAEDKDAAYAILRDIRLLIAPTGAGKTSTFVRLFAAQVRNRGRLGGPVCLMLPSYANIDEVRGRHDAEEREKAEAAAIDELTAAAAGLKVLVYKGKIRGGCMMAAQVQALQAAGVGTSGLCEGKADPDDPEGKPVKCRHYDTCPVIAMRREIPGADLILLPTAFVDTTIPRVLTESVKALVVDERCWTNLIHVTKIPLTGLKFDRRAPYYTDKEKAAAKKECIALLDPQHLLHDRRELNELLIKWAREGVDLAKGVLGYSRLGADDRAITGEDLLASAIFVDKRTTLSRVRVKPNLTVPEVEVIVRDDCDKHLWGEKRLYALIAQRVEWLELDRNSPGPTRRACGTRDRRIALLRHGETETLRISWRTEPNFAALPMLMLDASADADIVSKLWSGRKVEVTNIPATLHLRVLAAIDGVYSNRSMLPSAQDTARGAIDAARRQIGVKAVLNACTALWGHSRVLVGSTQAVKTDFARSWAHLPNVDWLHFGATRGFDFAKHHGVAVSIGRMEMPPDAIDGIVAALTYDDQDVEEAIDALGTGCDAAGKPIKAAMIDRRIAMRDGSDLVVTVPQWPGFWAAKVQRQFREEETRQFIGRLRPVYREGEAPLAILMSSVIPEGIVVDDVVSLWDLQVRADLWDAVRRTGGILDIRLCTAAAPEYRDTNAQAREVFSAIKAGGGVSKCRIGRGFVRAEYRTDKSLDRGEVVLALASIGDIPREIVDAQWSIGKEVVDAEKGVRIAEVGYDGPRLEMARKPDEKLVAEVGDLDRRRRDEEALRETTAMEALIAGTSNHVTRDITVGSGDLKGERVTLTEAMLLRRTGKLQAA